MVENTGNRWYEAELHRLQGVLMLQHDVKQHPEAVKCFKQALQVAREQQAKSLELRAALSLSRLLPTTVRPTSGQIERLSAWLVLRIGKVEPIPVLSS